MDAHPMIQPTDWQQPPDSIDKSMSSERLALYRLIWDSAISCTMVQPMLEHTRSQYENGSITLSIASVHASKQREGYWKFRTDFPYSSYPTTRKGPCPPKTISVKSSWVHKDGVLTLGQLIETLGEKHVATPAYLKTLLKNTLNNEQQGPFMLLSKSDKTNLHEVNLSDKGQKALSIWKEKGLLGSSMKLATLMDSLVSGETDYREILNKLELGERASNAGQYIDDKITQWAGVDRISAIKANQEGQLNLNHAHGLPAWLNPETKLSKEHPLRKLRQIMELALMKEYKQWLQLNEPERIEARYKWLQKKMNDKEIHKDFQEVSKGFDVLTYWLTGKK